MQVDVPKHQSGKPNLNPAEPRKIKLGEHLTLLDKTLAYYVSQQGRNCFWGRVLNGCSILVDHKLGTAGVVLEDSGKRHAFLYDPAYFQSLTPANRRCTLVHEAVHVACLHIIRYMRLMTKASDDKVRKAIAAVFNIAADMEANDTYVRLEKEFSKTLEEGEFWHLPEQHNFPTGQSMETYIELLLKNLPAVVQKLKQMAQKKEKGEDLDADSPMQGYGTYNGRNRGRGNSPPDDERTDDEKAADTASSVAEAADRFEKQIDQLLGIHGQLTNDTHSRWMKAIEEMAKEDPTKLEQLIQQIQKTTGEAIDNAYKTTSQFRGTVPGGMQQRIAAMLKQPTVPWTSLMREWVMSNMGRLFEETTRLPSLSLMNVEGIEPFPGQVLEPEINLTWITDTSGSMSDDCFQKASSEMSHLIQQTKAIRVHHIQVDTVIQNETIHDNTDPEVMAQMRYGYGGTTLKAAFARAVNVDLNLWRAGVVRVEEVRQPDVMVVFTDGYIEDMAPVMAEFHPGCPTLWLITPNGQPPEAITRLGAPHFVIRIPSNHY